MARGRNNNGNQIINVTDKNHSQIGISFNYSENFNRITELTIENFLNGCNGL